MDIVKLMIDSGIPASFLADKIGMARSTFNNKLKGNNGSYFTVFEVDKVRDVVSDVVGVLVDFLEAGGDNGKRYNWQRLNDR